ncbi:MAG TPA: formylmethanofuran dehydrogenase subunit C [Gemmatimonadaceae bacterium]|nr:formylmethanofuran dehydrogenase subunit C [Gemmatimonadaceae bacterium]
MSDAITLTLRAPVARRLEVESIAPNALAMLDESAIARLPVWDGPQAIPLGDVFQVRGGRSDRVRVAGDLTMIDAIGAGMTAGDLEVDGSVGRYVGTRMAGGALRVSGDAGYGAGLEMTGGLLDIAGSAGDRLGAGRLAAPRGMTGGEIIVRRNAGAEIGATMRRGTVVVAGNAGPRAGLGMIAGNVIVLGSAGEDAGRFNKRGTIAVFGRVSIPPTYRFACTYRPPHIAVTVVHLRSHRGLAIADDTPTTRFHRYGGDLAELGRGEILARSDER